MNTEQREQRIAETVAENLRLATWTLDDGTVVEAADTDVWRDMEWLLARLSAVEQERDELQRQLNKAWALEKYGCEKWQAAEARVEAAEQALREILNWSYDRELGVGTFVLLVQESARAVLAPSQDSEQ